MTSTDARATIEAVTGAVSYLRVSVDPSPADRWMACAQLVADGDLLTAVVNGTKAGRTIERDDVAMSLFVQAYAFRVASLVIGGWLLDGAVIDADPARMSIALGRDRPNDVAIWSPTLRPVPASAAIVWDSILDHLRPLVATAHGSTRIGERLLWGNVAAACASSFGAFNDHLGADVMFERVSEFFAAAADVVAGLGSAVAVGPGWAWERTSCCLWYQQSGGARCQDCSLFTAEERATHYAALATGTT